MDIQISTIRQIFFRHNTLKPGRDSIFLLHGFADSGLAYIEAFDSILAQNFNLYVPDFPGFGVSPLNPAYTSISSHADLLAEIIEQELEGRVYIIAHSIGGLVGTRLCQQLGSRVGYYFSIEGNLTPPDSYYSSKPLQYESPAAFFAAFEAEIYELGKSQDRFKRYYSSLRYASPQGMHYWAESSQHLVQDGLCGQEFSKLACPKLYIWGDVDTPAATQTYIKTAQVPNRFYPGVGHWHMHENAAQLYSDIDRIIREG